MIKRFISNLIEKYVLYLYRKLEESQTKVVQLLVEKERFHEDNPDMPIKTVSDIYSELEQIHGNIIGFYMKKLGKISQWDIDRLQKDIVRSVEKEIKREMVFK